MYIFFASVKTYIRGEKMYSRRLNKALIPVIYGICVICFLISMYFAGRLAKGYLFKESDNLRYVDGEITEEYDQDVPVVVTDTVIVRPYLNDNVKKAKSFYDYEADASEQENAIIYYEGTYMQNSGIDYSLEDTFDVVSILDGVVISVEENEILGKTIQIRHSNDLISVYQSLSDIAVKADDKVIQGQIIAKSGNSNVNSELGNHLHFELYYNGTVVNPEKYYDKSINDL